MISCQPFVCLLTLTLGLPGSTAQSPSGRANCSVPQEFEVAWWYAPPFVLPNEEEGTDEIVGPLVDLLDMSVKTCCNQQSSVVFRHRFDNFHEMEEKWMLGTFAAPAVRTQLQQAFNLDREGIIMLPVVESPGAVYFKKNKLEGTGTTMDILLTGWPLLLLVLISAGFAGVVMWLLDTYWNPEQFPRPFLRGTWEGFWWAFVTMTTVGYGDRAPTSFLGKCFAILWILAGIIILSIFTAAITTALSAGLDTDNDPLSGHKIAVLKGTEELKLLVAEGGVPVVYHNASRMMEAVCADEGELDGAFLEYFAFTYLHLLHAEGCLRRVRAIKNPAMYGIMVQGVGGEHVSSSVIQCFINHISRNRHKAFDSLEKHILSLQSLGTKGGADVSTQIFQGVNLIGLAIAVGILGFIIIVGVIWEKMYWKPKQKKKTEDAEEAGNTVSVGKSPNNNQAPDMNTYQQNLPNTVRQNNAYNSRDESPDTRSRYLNNAYNENSEDEEQEKHSKINNTHSKRDETQGGRSKRDRQDRPNNRQRNNRESEVERSRSRQRQERDYDHRERDYDHRDVGPSLQDVASGRGSRKDRQDTHSANSSHR